MLTSPAAPTRFDDPSTPLSAVTFVVLDLETTGTAPGFDEITEVGAVKYRGGEPLGSFDTLVNPGTPIPPFISVLTGITERMVLPAPRVDEVLPALLEFIGNAVIVGHNIRFDISFLDAALVRRGGSPLENPRVDTLGLARRLVRDEVDDLRLGTLARHLHAVADPCHRAKADADATADVFHALLERAGTFGVLGLDDLLALPRVRRHPTTSKLRLTARVPRRRGVYQLRGRDGAVLYVGRADNLRAGVRAHFRDDRRQVPQLVRETEAVDWCECDHELEAAVREVRLVRRLAPRFNRIGAGARRTASLKLTLAEPYPRLAVVHRARDDGALYFGPLASSAAVHALKAAIEAAVPLRRCTARVRRDGARVECPAESGTPCPCTGAVSEDAYRAVVDTVVRGLRDDPELLLDPLDRRMREHAAAGDLEAAARARDQRAAMRGVLHHQRLLGWLRGSGTLRVLTPSGVVELEDGRLAIAGDPDEPGEETTDELAVVARWLTRQIASGRAQLLEPIAANLPLELSVRG